MLITGYWLINKELEALKWQCLKKIKLLFEMLASEVSSGQSFAMAVERCGRLIQEERDTPRFLKNALKVLRLRLSLNTMSKEIFMDMAKQLDYTSLGQLDSMIYTSIQTGVRLDQLLSFYAEQLGEDLKLIETFQAKLSEKRNEFYLMLQIPFLGVVFIESAMSGYFKALYTGNGRGMAIFLTLIYSLAIHLYYLNEERLVKQL